MVMKLITDFEIVDMIDENIAVPVGTGSEKIHGVLKLNKSGAEILDCLTKGMTEGEIVETLSQKYDNDYASLENDVHDIIESLKTAGLLI